MKKLIKISISCQLLLTRAMKKIKKFEKLGSKIRDLNRSITKNSYEYDEKHMNIEFNSDELPLNKAIAIPSMIIVIRAVFL